MFLAASDAQGVAPAASKGPLLGRARASSWLRRSLTTVEVRRAVLGRARRLA